MTGPIAAQLSRSAPLPFLGAEIPCHLMPPTMVVASSATIT